MEVIEKGAGQAAPYSIRQMGIYLVVDTEVGLVLLWDRKTSIFLKLSPEFKVGPHPHPGMSLPRPRPGASWDGCGVAGQTQSGESGGEPQGVVGRRPFTVSWGCWDTGKTRGSF